MQALAGKAVEMRIREGQAHFAKLYFLRKQQFCTLEVAIQPGQRVLDRGLYRYLRHPSYAATFVTILGYALALGNWLSLAVMLVIPGLVYGWRMRVKEAALTEAFGDEYRAYMRRMKRLVPFIL